jgi:hypothetical protein
MIAALGPAPERVSLNLLHTAKIFSLTVKYSDVKYANRPFLAKALKPRFMLLTPHLDRPALQRCRRYGYDADHPFLAKTPVSCRPFLQPLLQSAHQTSTNS